MKLRVDIRVFKAAAALAAAVCLIAGALFLLNRWEAGQGTETEASRTSVSGGGTDSGRELTLFDGKWYAPRGGLETVLLLGVDKFADSTQSGYKNNQQTDFILLLVIDREAGRCTALHLNRDTMTQIPILGVKGEPAGTFTGQLALAHTYGSGDNDSCRNTVRAVSDLLYGVRIDHYAAMTMDGVALLNDLAGGVTLEVMDDFSGIDSSLVQGKTVTLRGQQALTYVRTRGGLEDSSNLHRMERQRQYLSALQKQLSARAEEDAGFVLEALLNVSEYLVSDCTAEQLSALSDAVRDFGVGEIRTTEGEAVQGEPYMEFHVDEQALQALIVELFYERAEANG